MTVVVLLSMDRSALSTSTGSSTVGHQDGRSARCSAMRSAISSSNASPVAINERARARARLAGRQRRLAAPGPAEQQGEH